MSKAAAKTKKSSAPKKHPAKPAVAGYAGLPPEHQRFVDEYLIDHNATRAYMRVPGTTQNQKSAAVQAARLLTKPNVQQALAERSAAAKSRCEMSVDRILLEAARIATFDVRKLYNSDGSMKMPHEIDDDTAAGVMSIETIELFDGTGKDRKRIGDTKKVRVVDKKGSVELAMKHLGLLTERVQIVGHESILEQLR